MCHSATATSSEKLAKLFGLRDRSALVTGGARGIGKVIALLFADLGADVAVVDVNGTGAEATARDVAQRGARSLAIEADVVDRAQVDDAVARSWDFFGHIDIVVNNAGICTHVPAEDMSPGDWQKIMDVNLNAVFSVSQAVARRMIRRGKGGRIVNIASMSGLIVNHPQQQAAYNTSKAAVIHLTKSLAAEWAPHGILVNAISPGYTLTEMTQLPHVLSLHQGWVDDTPMGRLAQPEEIAAAVAFLAGDACSYMTGHNLVVDGGFTIW